MLNVSSPFAKCAQNWYPVLLKEKRKTNQWKNTPGILHARKTIKYSILSDISNEGLPRWYTFQKWGLVFKTRVVFTCLSRFHGSFHSIPSTDTCTIGCRTRSTIIVGIISPVVVRSCRIAIVKSLRSWRRVTISRHLLGLLPIFWVLWVIVVSLIWLLILSTITVTTFEKILINGNATISSKVRHFFGIGFCCLGNRKSGKLLREGLATQ